MFWNVRIRVARQTKIVPVCLSWAVASSSVTSRWTLERSHVKFLSSHHRCEYRVAAQAGILHRRLRRESIVHQQTIEVGNQCHVSDQHGRRDHRRILIIVVLLLLVAVGGLWRQSIFRSDIDSVPGPEAREANVDSYVGSSRCADCHPDKAAAYQQSGHSKTFHFTSQMDVASSLNGRTFEDTARGLTLKYSLDADGLAAAIPDIFGEDRFPLPIALGSGSHAFTFLTLIPGDQHPTVAVEHRVTAYSATAAGRTEIPNAALGITPGHSGLQITKEVETFGRIIRGETMTNCIACHTTTADIVNHQLVNLRPNVGCESCHGPGRDHVEAAESGSVDPVISRRHDEIEYLIRFASDERDAMAEVEVCGKCHRMPDDVSDYRINPHNTSIIRFQPIGMLQSSCFLNSNGRLSCSSCHDPHEPASARSSTDYEQSCLKCHADSQTDPQVSCSVSPMSGCVDCHMPSIELLPGIRFHDHWIRIRQPGEPTASDKAASSSGHGMDSVDDHGNAR